MTKLLRSKKVSGPDMIHNEMRNTGIRYFIANYLILFLKAVFSLALGAKELLHQFILDRELKTTLPTTGEYALVAASENFLPRSSINARLKKHLLQQNMLHQAQIDFLSNHRTSDHILP